MIQYLRQHFWISGLRKYVKQVMNQCIVCVRQRQQVSQQIMAPLPAVRVTPGRCFEAAGVDYFGPFQLKAWGGRCTVFTKGYGAIFICMKTKAVHIEAVSDLTTAAFIAAFTRFAARRGHCKVLYSDNATNFVGAQGEFEAIQISWEMLNLDEKWLKLRTRFVHITPAAPHQGGLWEAA